MGMTHGSHALIDEQSIGCFVVDPAWEKQSHKPPIWEWFIDVYSNYKNGDLGDGLPVVPARGGAEVALKIYIRPFSSIELACAVRQRSPCVRAHCETGVLFHMSHLKLHVTLHT